MTTPSPAHILRVYVTLMLLSTFASSFIWGVNTLFLLDAGLSMTGAFAANAFFTLGQVIFEVPTGVVADTAGRRRSYLLGAATLLLSTLAYLVAWRVHAPFWAWAVASVFLGLGFTFFSGATEAWLVDALHATGYDQPLERAFARGQIAAGVAMLTGTLTGGVVAQATNLGVPYILRIVALGLTFATAFLLMKDVGFAPRRDAGVAAGVRAIVRDSLAHGVRNPSVRWVMLTSPFIMGAGGYVFYAMQPHLLDLHGDAGAYAVAGLAAAIVALAQIAGGLAAPLVPKLFARRTSFLAAGVLVGAGVLAVIGLSSSFAVALAMIALWGLVFTTSMPVRQAYLNGLIPSAQRATVLSSDSFAASAGGVVFAPALGRVADVGSIGASYLAAAGVQLLAAPFFLLARRTRARSDDARSVTPPASSGA
jgi:MFS family permease